MYKTFILAASIAVFPLSKNRLGTVEQTLYPANTINYKSSFPEILQPSTQKNKEPYSKSWYTTAQENIRKSEYNFSWDEKRAAYSTPNRENNLRFYYNDKGFEVEPRTTQIPLEEFDPMAPAAEIKYRSIANLPTGQAGWKVNFNLNKKQVGNGKWQIVNNSAEYITDKITVQYINNDDGMRQNFIVRTPFSTQNDLSIDFSIQTKLKISFTPNSLSFFHKKGKVLVYNQLKVWDATGKLLEASFKKITSTKFCIKVDDRSAVYPITIDPITTTPAVMLESNQVNAGLGFSVAGAGDVNGDGYSDVVAGAMNYDSGEIDEGAAFIYHGSATGISSVAVTMVQSNQVNTRLGISVATAGDVNGDGNSDIIVGATLYDNGELDEGAAFIYHGSATGINNIASSMVQSNQASAQMGYAASLAGDVNGDGYSDIIVGAWLYDNGETNEGVAFIYHGSVTGINTTAATLLQSNQAASGFGLSVAAAGDVNGDGYSDVIVGAEDYDNGQTDEGVIFIYHGSATGINNVAASMAQTDQTLSQFGYSVAGAGDVNGDGYSDVVSGAYLFEIGEINEGAAFIYHGSATGINVIAADTVQSNQAGAGLGVSVACAGDINSDGYADIIAGSYLYDNVEFNEGGAFILMGSATGINNTAAAILESNQANANLGRAVAGAGDVNGDGYSDVIAGANQYDNVESNEGAAFVYHGSAAGINTTATSNMETNQGSAFFGYFVSSAGDVNRDGYSDIIVGAYNYDNGQVDEGAAFVYHGTPTGINTTAAAIVESNQAGANMGIEVACAGDVNGDGYNDVIVGALYYDNGQSNEGSAFVYHGSVTGINTTAAAIVESNQVNANMGVSATGAGDVNGDGFSDVIVGAYTYDNGIADEGAAFIYHGSATGINTTAAAMVESNQLNAYMGYSAASAGDVNGDGFSDIVVGCYSYDNGQVDEGGAFIYHGSATGINTTAAAILENNQAGSLLGYRVSGAGDVNGDGYGDVILGAYLYDNGQSDEGGAFVYHGSATGINTTAAAIVESNQANVGMGVSVSNAGDLNGDGYSDVIVGAILYDNGQADEGGAFIYYGSPTGINIIPTTSLESNQVNGRMGISVAGAGDVNGDGFSDALVGVYLYDNGQTDEGTALLYHGNNPGFNKQNNLRLYNSDLVTPINSSNFFFSNFGAGLFAKSFLGKTRGKLVWETRLNYNAYSGTPITNSTFFTAQQGSYTDLGISGMELKNIIQKISGGRYTKLRARIKYDPATALTGQVYSPWRNVSSIIDANNLGVLPIDLISFNVAWVQKGKMAKLDFTTDKESGICCFDIEKSTDGFNFFSIGSVPAKNATGIQSYSFIDNNATGKKQFYRLKIKGIAGQVEHSNIQQLKTDKSTEILVFPNPTTDVLQLQLNGPFKTMNVQILNSAGQLVKRLVLSSSNQTLTIPVQELAPGKYWLHLQSTDQKQILQFVKQ